MKTIDAILRGLMAIRGITADQRRQTLTTLPVSAVVDKGNKLLIQAFQRFRSVDMPSTFQGCAPGDSLTLTIRMREQEYTVHNARTNQNLGPFPILS